MDITRRDGEMKKKKAYKILVGKSEAANTFWIPRLRWQNIGKDRKRIKIRECELDVGSAACGTSSSEALFRLCLRHVSVWSLGG